MMSNSNVDNVKNEFKHENFIINEILCKRRINSKKPQSTAKEIIIKNY